MLRRRVPELAVGVLLVGLGAVAVLVLTTSDEVPTQVVALAQDVERGEVLSAGDLTSVGLLADAPVTVVPATEMEGVVGMLADAHLPAGSLLAESQLASNSNLPPGFVVLGVRLEAGAYPSSQLREGDLVDVLSLAEEPGEPTQLLAGSVQLARVQFLAVDPGSDLFVSLLVPVEERDAVAAAAGVGRIRLAEVSA